MPRHGAILSLNARGVPTFSICGSRGCIGNIGPAWRAFLDLGQGWVCFLRLLGSNSVLSLMLVLLAQLFYWLILKSSQYLDNVWTIYCFLVVLPILILVVMVYIRRNNALKQTAKVKVLVLSMFQLHRDFGTAGEQDTQHLQQVQLLLHDILDRMLFYFARPRPTATHFYWPCGPQDPPPGSLLSDEACAIHSLHGAVLKDIKKLMCAGQGLRARGCSDVVMLEHSRLASELHMAFQEMSLVKEMRTPLILRTCCRFYATVILPLLLGPYWASLGKHMPLTFSMFIAVLTHSIILGLLNLSVMYEDPFDNQASSQSVDGICMLELVDTCKWLMEDDDADDPHQPHTLLNMDSFNSDGLQHSQGSNAPMLKHAAVYEIPHHATNGHGHGMGFPASPAAAAAAPHAFGRHNGMTTAPGPVVMGGGGGGGIGFTGSTGGMGGTAGMGGAGGMGGTAGMGGAGGTGGAAAGGRPALTKAGSRAGVFAAVGSRRSAVRSPAAMASPPMPPIIGSQLPEGAREEYD